MPLLSAFASGYGATKTELKTFCFLFLQICRAYGAGKLRGEFSFVVAAVCDRRKRRS